LFGVVLFVAVGEELVKQHTEAPHVGLVGEFRLCDGLRSMPGGAEQAMQCGRWGMVEPPLQK